MAAVSLKEYSVTSTWYEVASLNATYAEGRVLHTTGTAYYTVFGVGGFDCVSESYVFGELVPSLLLPIAQSVFFTHLLHVSY